MKPLILEKPIAINELQITATITADDCKRHDIDPAYIGERTFGLRRWQSLTGKKHGSIKAIYLIEIKARAEGKKARDMREIVGLIPVVVRRNYPGSYNTRGRDIEQFSDAAKRFIYGCLA